MTGYYLGGPRTPGPARLSLRGGGILPPSPRASAAAGPVTRAAGVVAGFAALVLSVLLGLSLAQCAAARGHGACLSETPQGAPVLTLSAHARDAGADQ